MKNRIQSLTFVATLAVVFGMISWGSALAQTSPSTPDQATPQTQPTPDTPPSQQTPQTQPTPSPDNPPATQQTPSQSPSSSQMPSSQSPNSQTPSQNDNASPSTPPPGNSQETPGAAASSDSQSFSGTVEKQGDKYVLKDDSGKTYDIDHQAEVSKFEGKRVRVKGTLDASGTKILVK